MPEQSAKPTNISNMRRVDAPNFSFIDVFNDCVTGKHEPNRSNLLALSPILEKLESSYRTLATNRQLHLLQKPLESSLFVGGKRELFKLYDERMVRNPSPGRHVYEHILAAGLPRCPYCNHNRPRQLDHVLPKEETGFPEISLAPINLVPICSDCNFFKLAHTPASIDDQFFHPYFESPENFVWLSASTDYRLNGELTVLFDTVAFAGNELFSDRVSFQFTKLNLGELYAAQASTLLEDIRFGLTELFYAHGEDEVRSRMYEDYVSCNTSDQNSWRAAMYRCLANDVRFCRMEWVL